MPWKSVRQLHFILNTFISVNTANMSLNKPIHHIIILSSSLHFFSIHNGKINMCGLYTCIRQSWGPLPWYDIQFVVYNNLKFGQSLTVSNSFKHVWGIYGLITLHSHLCIFSIYRAANQGVTEPSGCANRGISFLSLCPLERNMEPVWREKKSVTLLA